MSKKVVLQYFGENVDETNCLTAHFKIIAGAISDVPNHGIKKVIYLELVM